MPQKLAWSDARIAPFVMYSIFSKIIVIVDVWKQLRQHLITAWYPHAIPYNNPCQNHIQTCPDSDTKHITFVLKISRICLAAIQTLFFTSKENNLYRAVEFVVSKRRAASIKADTPLALSSAPGASVWRLIAGTISEPSSKPAHAHFVWPGIVRTRF